MSAFLIAALMLQSAPAQPPPPAPAPAQAEGAKVVSYPAGYFAQFRPDTAQDMLNRVPGFSPDYGGGQRGFAGGEGNIRLDGQLPASRGDGMSAVLRRLPASAVERIDIVTGGAGGIDMQGQSIIANVIRKKNLGLRTTVIGGGSIYEDADPTGTVRIETQRTDGGTLLDGLFIAFSDNFGTAGTRTQGLATPAVSDFSNAVHNDNARVSGAYETPFAGGRTRVNATYGWTGSNSEFIDTPRNGGVPSSEVGRGNSQLGEAGARYTRQLAGGVTAELSLFHQYRRNDSKSDFERGSTFQHFSVENRQNEDILRGIVRWPKRGAWTFDGGAEAAFNTLDTFSTFALNGVPSPLPNSQNRVEELRGEAFAAAVWTISPTFNLQLGARIENSTISTEGANPFEKSLTFFKPRAIATWTPAQGHLAVLRVERSVDQLSFNDFAASASLINQTFVSGAVDLVPAENLIVEGRYEYRFAGRGALVLTYQWRDIDNVVGRNLFVTPTGAVIEAADNVGSGTREFWTVGFTTPTERLGLKGGLFRVSHTWRDSEIFDPVTLAGRRFSNEYQWEWNASLSQEIPDTRWRWEVTASESSALDTFLPREFITSKYSPWVNVNIEFRQSPAVTYRLELNNVADQHGPYLRLRSAGIRGQPPLTVREIRDNMQVGGGRWARFTVRKSF